MDFSHLLTDSYTLALVCLLSVCWVVLALYYGLFHFRVGRLRRSDGNKASEQKLPPVSVILYAQNDAEWLRTNLIYLLEQDYPDFEVVVVDYLSSDDTKFILQVLAENYKHLKTVSISENVNGYKGRKYPLSIGIKSAKNDILLLADPDCMPMDLNRFCWIREMVAGYSDDRVDIVLGFCGIQNGRGLFNWLQQYDNLEYSAQYLGAAMLRHPYTGNGRNLSYRRNLFLKKKGFIYHYHIPDGADDMFVNQNATRRNVSCALTPGAFTVAAAQPSFGQWHLLRKHRTVTHRFYPASTKFMRAIRPLNILLFYASAAALLALGSFPWEVVAGAVALKFAWQIVCTAQSARRLAVKPPTCYLAPLFEIYFLLADTILHFSPLPRKQN